MTDQEILTKAIENAQNNGYLGDELNGLERKTLMSNYSKVLGKQIMFRWWSYSIIFSHDFAKAFWGEADDESKLPSNSSINLSPSTGPYEFNRAGWQYHLQQMVLEENPIKYLERFL